MVEFRCLLENIFREQQILKLLDKNHLFLISGGAVHIPVSLNDFENNFNLLSTYSNS
jgi:hypothetical protein